MTVDQETSSPLAVVLQLRDEGNADELDTLVDRFAPRFRSELPTFPMPRSSATRTSAATGRESSCRCLTSPQIVRSTTDADTVWVEWRLQGSQLDGRPHLARGVVIFTAVDARIASNRFHVHPVRSGPSNVLRRVNGPVQRHAPRGWARWRKRPGAGGRRAAECYRGRTVTFCGHLRLPASLARTGRTWRCAGRPRRTAGWHPRLDLGS